LCRNLDYVGLRSRSEPEPARVGIVSRIRGRGVARADQILRRLLAVDRAGLAASGLAYDERLDETHLGYRAKRMLAEARAAGET